MAEIPSEIRAGLERLADAVDGERGYMARPSKYDPDYCNQIVEFCKDGSSLTSFAAAIDVCRDTLTQWAETHEEFSLAVKRAKAQCAAWWEKTARSNAMGAGNGNATLCIFGLKNMAPEDWREKNETVLTGHLKHERMERVVVDPANPDR